MKTTAAISMIAVALGFSSTAVENNQSTPSSSAAQAAPAGGKGTAAMSRATEDNAYLFAFFYEKDDDATRATRNTFDEVVRKITPAPHSVVVDRTAPEEKQLVTKWGIDRAQLPFVLALAPDGAVTGGYKGAGLTEAQLRDSVASTGLPQCLKSLQAQRVVLVCLQNDRTQAHDAAMKGVNEFEADAKCGALTDIVEVDPSDAKEAKLLAQLQADSKAKAATTVMLASPGVLIATGIGPTTKDSLMARLQKAMAACGPGASPGCCPPPKK